MNANQLSGPFLMSSSRPEDGFSPDMKMRRRDFLKAAPAATFVLMQTAHGVDLQTSSPPSRIKIEPFDYQDVRLLASRWQKQYQAARDFWLGLPENDILHGYRLAAGLPAPGKPLGGWCQANSDTVFGQWLSGLSRLYRATGDKAIRDKAVRLFEGWAATVPPDGNCGMGHYAFDKLVGGLVDLKWYADCNGAVPMLEKVMRWAEKSLSRENVPASHNGLPSGRPAEWYTLAENLYRAFQLTGDPRYQTFAEAWLYPAYWNKFATTADPPDAYGFHAYSHVNTFSSAAMAYAVTGEQHYLDSIRNAYDWLQNVQGYATGGYGPMETTVANRGGLWSGARQPFGHL